MRRSRAPFSGSGALCHMRWSADFITDTSESEFSAHTAVPKTSILRRKVANGRRTCSLLCEGTNRWEMERSWLFSMTY
jgi:hypothetical protein